jgi:hypothetical protein
MRRANPNRTTWQCRIDLLAEGDLIELVQEGSMEALADAVGCRVRGGAAGCTN